LRNGRQRIVIKIGSSTLTCESGSVDSAYIATVAAQIAQLHGQGDELMIVSSGAIVAGLEALGVSEKPKDIPTLQAAAAIGQVELAKHYNAALSAHGLRMAQVLLTRFEIDNRTAYLHARDTLQRLLELGVVPLINENDTVAVDEIRFGDNDTLAAQVAILVKADLVVLLSDIDGLYTADPRTTEDAELLQHIAALTEELVAAAGAAGSTKGSGGMVTKLEAAKTARRFGIDMVLMHGAEPERVYDMLDGAEVGTLFLA